MAALREELLKDAARAAPLLAQEDMLRPERVQRDCPARKRMSAPTQPDKRLRPVQLRRELVAPERALDQREIQLAVLQDMQQLLGVVDLDLDAVARLCEIRCDMVCNDILADGLCRADGQAAPAVLAELRRSFFS